MNKIIFSLMIILLLFSFSCQKEDLTVYHTVGYNIVKPEGVIIDSILYKDAQGNIQAIANPFGRVYLSMKVEEGFLAELSVKGTLPDSSFCTMTVSHQMGEDTESKTESITEPGFFDITLDMLIE